MSANHDLAPPEICALLSAARMVKRKTVKGIDRMTRKYGDGPDIRPHRARLGHLSRGIAKLELMLEAADCARGEAGPADRNRHLEFN